MDRTEPALTQFGPAIAWLLGKEVSSSRLAVLFGTTGENIRVIAFRSRQAAPAATNYEALLRERPSRNLAATIGIRAAPDEVVATPTNRRKLEQLRHEIIRAEVQHSTRYQFAEGTSALLRLAPRIGFAGDVERIALSAQLHQSLAWFSVHAGRSRTATREAALSRNLWRWAYHELPRREFVEHFIQAALIGSQALLLDRRAPQAWKLLDIAADAARVIGTPEGSEFARQRGVSLFQLREDERAAVQFQKATQAMEKLGEATTPAQLLMTGSRHLNLLGRPDWESSQTVLEAAEQTFGADTLEVSMAIHWAAACGLSTDSTQVWQQASDLIGEDTGHLAQFGHQATIRKLLTITPELGLDLRLQRMWVRRTLYENAYRNR
jgi:hypothetical protein